MSLLIHVGEPCFPGISPNASTPCFGPFLAKSEIRNASDDRGLCFYSIVGSVVLSAVAWVGVGLQPCLVPPPRQLSLPGVHGQALARGNVALGSIQALEVGGQALLEPVAARLCNLELHVVFKQQLLGVPLGLALLLEGVCLDAQGLALVRGKLQGAAQRAEQGVGGEGQLGGREGNVGRELDHGRGARGGEVLDVGDVVEGVVGVRTVGGVQSVCGGRVQRRGRGGSAGLGVRGALGFVGEDELDALELVGRVGRVVLGDGVRGPQGFRLVDGAHVLGEGVGAGEGAVALWGC